MDNENSACVNVNAVGRMHRMRPCSSDNDLNSFTLGFVFMLIKTRSLYIIGE